MISNSKKEKIKLPLEDTLGFIKKRIKEKGIIWTIHDISRRVFLRKFLDKIVILNKKNNLSNTDSFFVDLPSHTIEENRRAWNNYDWSQGGDEWTLDVKKYKEQDPNKWKTTLVNEMIFGYLKKNLTILEIGPGGGRWTEIFQPFAKKLILCDISKNCIDICKKRFKSKNNIEYYLINERLDFIEKESIDYLWSYDVFVHINPTDIEKYIYDISKFLKPGGYAVIHHSGSYSNYKLKNEGWRAYLGSKSFAKFVTTCDMIIIQQNEILPQLTGDVITVFKKPTLIENN